VYEISSPHAADNEPRDVVENAALVLELGVSSDEWNHDFRTDVDSSAFRSHGRLENGATLHFGDLGIADTKPTSPMAKHGVGFA
jgi:hypothetical protein